ncbi:TetR/AcrR family transcriptional regulator [Pontivivens ytuae]|uniref:TetR/AcrR family transcriptional regulator n=1 Tax=Pontivivens ytuae TaxID=2789856 RepID=A0A7S9QBG6_9RHOB|nr:TetR/AcrR family transcriptional regulator [Pontivivens ytuae]QPH52312.1 TetR/AcrR family transcriptional regulator [Pontivivens ytuae]
MPRPSDAKSRLIDTAIRLFRCRGYHGVGLTELLEVSGAPKGSFYHHFPGGKEELGAVAVRTAGHRIAQLMETAFADATSMDEGAERLTQMIAEGFAASDYTAGCPVTTVLLDTVPQSEMLSKAGRAAFAEWRAVLVRHAERLGDDRDIDAMGTALLTAIEGGWMLARIQRSPEPILMAGRAFRMA